MLNKEKFAKEIVEASVYGSFALKDGIPISCRFNRCCDCDWNNTQNCSQKRIVWANSEYIEKPVDPGWAINTNVLVSNDGKKWFQRHYAGFYSECSEMPYSTWKDGKTLWTSSYYEGTEAWKYAKLPEDE